MKEILMFQTEEGEKAQQKKDVEASKRVSEAMSDVSGEEEKIWEVAESLMDLKKLLKRKKGKK